MEVMQVSEGLLRSDTLAIIHEGEEFEAKLLILGQASYIDFDNVGEACPRFGVFDSNTKDFGLDFFFDDN